MSPQSNPKSPSQIVAELLLRNNVLTREQLQSAVSEARSQGRGLTYTLVSSGLIQEAVLLRLLSQIFKVRAVELSKIERIDPRVLGTVSADVARRGLVLPIHRSGDTLTVAMVNPTNRATIQQLGQLTGLTIQPLIATEFALRSAIPKHYNADQPRPQPQPQPQPRPQPSGKLRMQTRSRHTQRQRASAPVVPPAPAAPAQPPTPAVAPAPVIPSATDVPASAPNPAAPAAPAPATQSQGEGADPDELLRKQMEAEVALANMSLRGEDMGDEGSGGKLIAIGAAMLIGGGLLTCASYNAAGDGGSYVVTTGLFIAGAVLVFRGLMANWNP
jgi:hypothetical protein